MKSIDKPFPQQGLKPCGVCKTNRSSRTMAQWQLTRCWLCKWQLPRYLAAQLAAASPEAELARFRVEWGEIHAVREAQKATQRAEAKTLRLKAKLAKVQAVKRTARAKPQDPRLPQG